MARELLKDLIYGEQLVTARCTAQFAVGLTYSLNLEAMLTVPLALGDLGELDSDIKQSPMSLLEGIRRSSDKIAIFCNKGSIHVQGEVRTIFSLMEQSIFEVYDKSNIFTNFHPKLWLVLETDEKGDEWLRLAVMSRNLDYSSCLDICCSLRGKVGSHRSARGTQRHAPLKEMLVWLCSFASKAKAERIKELAEKLCFVDHFELSAPFKTGDDAGEDVGYSFFPLVHTEGLKHYGAPLRDLISAQRILVISPFIDAETLAWMTRNTKRLNGSGSKAILITRKEYVTRQIFDLFEEVWVPNDTMLDNTTAQIDIHAKMYLVHHTKGNDRGYTLYLGSANATRSGFSRNTEFLLQLQYKRTTIDRIDEMLQEFTSDNRFVPMDAPDPDATARNDADNDKERALKQTIRSIERATITPAGDGLGYDICLAVRGKYDTTVKIRPLQCTGMWKPIDTQVKFGNLPTALLSEFYVAGITNNDGTELEMVVKVKTMGMPPHRDNAIYSSIITNKHELLNYVAFMISDTPTEFRIMERKNKEYNDLHGNSATAMRTLPLYEQLLKTAHSKPKQIDEVIKVVERLNPAIVPHELRNILDMFHKVSKQIAKL